MNDFSKSSVEGAVLISQEFPPEHIIERILDVETLPPAYVYHNVKGYPWRFETKYYSAEINLYAVDKNTSLKEEFAERIKAIIFYFDGNKASSFKDVQQWLTHLGNVKPEVQLMVCTQCRDDFEDPALRKEILNWCAKNQFELVELNPLEENEEEEDLIPEAKGYSRIIEALQSHTWSNLVMKESGSKKKENVEHLEKQNIPVIESASSDDKENAGVKHVSCNTSTNAQDSKKIKVGNDELTLEENWLNNVVSGEDPDGESFEALFSKFASMKDRAEGLTGDARKKYAEEVAIAFWKAMGGDEDEIEGLDDD